MYNLAMKKESRTNHIVERIQIDAYDLRVDYLEMNVGSKVYHSSL